MSDNYIIEVDSEAAGVVVRDGRRFRFFAASRAFVPLDGRLFRTAGDAEREATRHVAAAQARGRAPSGQPGNLRR